MKKIFKINKKNNDHYVPQFFLRGFKVYGTKNSIILYKRNEIPIQRNIGKVANIQDFELFDNADPSVRNQLKEWDNLCAQLLNVSKLYPFELFLKNNLKNIFEFIAFQTFRIPLIREKIILEDSAKEDGRKILEKSKIDYVSRLMNQGNTQVEAEKKAESAFGMPLSLVESDKKNLSNKDFSLKKSIALAKEFSKDCANRTWQIVKPSDIDSFFITSDVPVLFHNVSSINISLLQYVSKSIIFMPLSKDIALFIVPNFSNSTKIISKSIGSNEVCALNKWMISCAYDEVYSHQAISWIKDSFDKTSKNNQIQYKWISDKDWNTI